MSLRNVTKYHIKRGNEPMTFRVLPTGKYNLNVKIGAFEVKTRN